MRSTPADWTDWNKYLSMYLDRIADKVTPAFPYTIEEMGDSFIPFLKMIFEKEGETRSDVDAWVLRFCKSREFESQDGWGWLFTSLRLQNAIDFCNRAGADHASGLQLAVLSSSHADQVLVHLLVDQWSEAAGIWMKIHALGMFYRMEVYSANVGRYTRAD